MMKPKPPEGMSEVDYEAIEAAVMETVRGRWFLAEFARRSHLDEMRQMLDAVARLEQVVTANQAAPVDPSIRLLVSRLKEVGTQLGRTLVDMRLQGVDETFCAGIEAQMRALGGLLRLNGSVDAGKPRLGPADSGAQRAQAAGGSVARIVEKVVPTGVNDRREFDRSVKDAPALSPAMPNRDAAGSDRSHGVNAIDTKDWQPDAPTQARDRREFDRAVKPAAEMTQPVPPEAARAPAAAPADATQPHVASGDVAAPLAPPPEPTFEQRLAALAATDRLPSLEKIRLFA
jgi:hypothetical protein